MLNERWLEISRIEIGHIFPLPHLTWDAHLCYIVPRLKERYQADISIHA